ncbi:hypothetical protein A3K73_01030 [Candidatus Pacearchaeota archaeon RBG_13_36_9]|nr:MAG: hypothetical protein A3K73_01030 [Candidatus Pacearchaeota archaeon RBG_13_36_9]HJX50085.1 hypothetical protein [Candidatus Nanoarchaeia archaeon]
MAKEFQLIKKFGENLLTRNSLASYFNEAINNAKEEEVVINFKGIKFISRSCAAEYIKLKEESNKKIIEKNMSKEVKAMFNVIVNQLKNSNFNLRKKLVI